MTVELVVEDRLGARRQRQFLRMLGPAFVAAVAYVDPGNVAANLSAAAGYGYLLVWVLVVANVAAVVVQYLSAKLGVVTGRTLPELVGQRLARAPRLLYWGQAEVTAAATEVAEVIGGALALQILFGLPLLLGGLTVFVVSMAILTVQSRHGQRAFELVVVGMLAVVTLGFLAGLAVSPADWHQALGGVVPRLEGSNSVLLAASMVGATVMPHAIYVHSGLARDRHRAARAATAPWRLRQILHATRWDVGCALAVAGGVNIGMLVFAAASLSGAAGTDTIPSAATAIGTHLGPLVGVAFGVGLLASSLASTSVGGYAGATITGGLLHRRIPVTLRRGLTVVPALLVLASGVDATHALVLSQVVLSLGIPFALVPLVWFTSRPLVMGEFVNNRLLRVSAVSVTAGIVLLNVVLLVLAVKE